MIYEDIIFIAIETGLSILLFWLTGYAERVVSSKWKLVYAVPSVFCIFAAGVFGFEVSLVPAYLGAFLLLYGFLKEDGKGRRISVAVSSLLLLISVPVCLLNPGYRKPDYLEDFQDGFAVLKERYILTKQKGIDFDSLYSEYLPRFQEVNRKHDEVENYILWQEFVQEFYDGHTGFVSMDEEIVKQAKEEVFGKDYGLSVMVLDDGTMAAVNVNPASGAYAAGIRNGTRILTWDGGRIEDKYEDIRFTTIPFPDDETKAFYLPIYASGLGGDTLPVRFVSDTGEEREALLQGNGAYAARMERTIKLLDQGVQVSNLDWVTVEGEVPCLRISAMSYDTESYSGTDYSAMQGELREKLLSLKEEGTDKIIIDARGNVGGSPYMTMAILALFAPEGEHFLSASGILDKQSGNFERDADGDYVIGGMLTYQGEGLWTDREVILLVNAETVSAGDYLAYGMKDFEHVTLMGFTKSNGSAQAVRMTALKSGILTLSTVPAMTEEGSVMIDSGADHKNPIDLDVQVPFDEAAVHGIFDENEDYLLKQAAE